MAAGRKVVVWHLELTDPARFRPVEDRGLELEVRRAALPCPELNRFFYAEVGRGWFWLDRLAWDERRWLAWLERPGVETWLAYANGTPVGYFELERQAGASVEIVYFGLLPRFVGRGWGGRLLTLAVEQAWSGGTRRVWLHTCSLDHPRALDNYRARGFELFKEELGP